MWLLVFVGMAQASMLVERILNRFVLLLIPTQRSESKKLSDRLVFSAVFAQIWTSLMAGWSVVVSILELLVQNLALVMAGAGVMIALTLVSDSSSFVYVTVFNTYNAGIGWFLHSLVVVPLKLLDKLFGALLPMWNVVIFMLQKLFTVLVFPVLQLNVDTLPTLAENLSLFFGAATISVFRMLTNVVDCMAVLPPDSYMDGWTLDERAAQVLEPYIEANLQCFANTNYITLDLLTPGLYLRGAVQAAMTIMTHSCPAAAAVLDVLLYPTLDYHFYKAVHTAVHAVVHVVVALPIITYHRCVCCARAAGVQTRVRMHARCQCRLTPCLVQVPPRREQRYAEDGAVGNVSARLDATGQYPRGAGRCAGHTSGQLAERGAYGAREQRGRGECGLRRSDIRALDMDQSEQRARRTRRAARGGTHALDVRGDRRKVLFVLLVRWRAVADGDRELAIYGGCGCECACMCVCVCVCMPS